MSVDLCLYLIRIVVKAVCVLQVDLFSKRLLLIPIHLEIHWSLITVDMTNQHINYYDSQGIVFKHTVDVSVVIQVPGGKPRNYTHPLILDLVRSQACRA